MDLLGWVDNYVFDVARTWSVGNTDTVRTELLGRSIELLDRTIAALTVGSTGDEVVRRVGEYYTGTE
jgi:methionine aminopeptidase